ncbi:acylphosphatase [Clostridium sp. Ade.TY]|uniref:acylphosphatase n=1 Tax=Clostridium sp. Ade.TY TaxID=1391647 RepID=UPI00042416D3|nr:acylphosphatase [Clostridium sp. Ade.TY]
MSRIKALVTGTVQGVGFRFFTQYQASLFNITGFVKNLSDGDVYLEAQGEKNNIKKFIEKLKKGNGFCKVKSISINELEPINSDKKFKVLY